MAKQDIPKTAIITPFGLYEYVSMPTQLFQRFMDSIFRDLDFVFCYIDDVLIVSRTPEETLIHLKEVFKRLREHRLSINMENCHFGQSKTSFLDYSITPGGYGPPMYRIEAIANFPKPTNIKELRRFLGVINFYRKCIPGAASLQAPLTTFLTDSKKNDNRPIIWNPDSEKAFEICKKSLAKSTINTFPCSKLPITIHTDASDSAIGGSIEQLKDTQWKPLSFFSRKLSETEKISQHMIESCLPSSPQ